MQFGFYCMSLSPDYTCLLSLPSFMKLGFLCKVTEVLLLNNNAKQNLNWAEKAFLAQMEIKWYSQNPQLPARAGSGAALVALTSCISSKDT